MKSRRRSDGRTVHPSLRRRDLLSPNQPSIKENLSCRPPQTTGSQQHVIGLSFAKNSQNACPQTTDRLRHRVYLCFVFLVYRPAEGAGLYWPAPAAGRQAEVRKMRLNQQPVYRGGVDLSSIFHNVTCPEVSKDWVLRRDSVGQLSF
jgi:hypothetical protein